MNWKTTLASAFQKLAPAVGTLSAAYLLAHAPASAQITITSSDMPQAGDSLRYSTALPADLPSGYRQGGADTTWDFSGLSAQAQQVERYRAPVDINRAYGLFFSGDVVGQLFLDSLPLGTITLNDIYNFYERSPDAFVAVGRGINVGGLPVPSTYSNPDTLYPLPMRFGLLDSGSYAVSFDLQGQFTLDQSGERSTEVDGWGRVITPLDTFQCLRVVSRVRRRDSLKVGDLPGGALNTQTLTYRWWAKNQGFPVMEVVGTIVGGQFVPNQVRYRDRYRPALDLDQLLGFSISDSVAVANTDTVLLRDTTSLSLQLGAWSIQPANFGYVDGTDSLSTTARVVFSQSGTYSVSRLYVSTLGTQTVEKANSIRVDPATSVEERRDGSTLRLYPVPARERLHVAGLAGSAPYRIYSARGRLVERGRYHPGVGIPLGSLAPGLYRIRLERARAQPPFEAGFLVR